MHDPFALVTPEPLIALRGLLHPRQPLIRIYFNTRPFGLRLLTADGPDSYELVFAYRENLPHRMSDTQLRRRQFDRFNERHDDDPVVEAYRRRKLRSLSDGDVVAINTRHYRCDPVDWSPLRRTQMRLTATADPRPPSARRIYR